MSEVDLPPNYKNLTIRVSEPKVVAYLKQLLFSYLQLRNLILLLIKRNHEEHVAQPEVRPRLFSYLSHPKIMRALLWGQAGGQLKEKVDFMRSYYAHDKMMQEAIALGHGLKDKVILELVKQIQGSWKSFFALRKMGEWGAREPKAIPLRMIASYSQPIDMECVSFKRKNRVRLLLERGRPLFVHCQHSAILEQIGDFSRVKRMEISLKQGEIYLLFSYLSKRIVLKLLDQGVTHLITSRNILEKKSIGCEMGRVQNQRFYAIPFGQLLDALKLFSSRYGLAWVDSVDEAYTSKTSCLSGDVLRAQRERVSADLGSDVFQGKRVMRGLFLDIPSGRRIHADINAAVNILRIYYGNAGEVVRGGMTLPKLSHPQLIETDALLRLLDQTTVDPCSGGELAPLGSPRF